MVLSTFSGTGRHIRYDNLTANQEPQNPELGAYVGCFDTNQM